MFRITRKADYAVFILTFLARRAAEEGRDALVSAQELASFSALNKSLVANLLKDLTRAGFLGSVRGARGGYRLQRDATEISLAQILRAVEGPFSFVECAHDQGPSADDGETSLANAESAVDHENCNLTGLCQSKAPLLVLHMRIQGMLEELKLSELAGTDGGASKFSSDTFPAQASIGGGNGSGTSAGRPAPPHAARRAGTTPHSSEDIRR